MLLQSQIYPFVQLEEMAIEMFESIMQQDNIPIDMSSSEEPISLSEYLESWRMKVWDTAYAAAFKGADSFKKSDSFRAYKDSTLYVRRLVFR